MNLNMDTISGRLSNKYQIERYGAKSNDMDLKCVLIYEPGRQMKPGFLYAAYTKDLPRKPPAHDLAVICVGVGEMEAWNSRRCQVLIILNETSLTSVFNEVAMLFEAFQEWDCKLKAELQRENGVDLKLFLQLGSQMLGNRLSVLNADIEELMNTTTENGLVKAEIFPAPVRRFSFEKAKEVANYEINLTQPYLSIAPAEEEHYCLNLFRFGKFNGTISLTACWRPFTAGDFPLADYFFRMFAQAYEKYLRFNEMAYDTNRAALYKLLTGEVLTAEDSHVFSLSKREAWAFFVMEKPKNRGQFPISHMATAICSIIDKSVAVVCEDMVMGVMKVSAEDHAWEITPQYISEFLKQSGLTRYRSSRDSRPFLEGILDYYQCAMGISNAFSDIRQFAQYQAQARYALNSGNLQGMQGKVFLFEDVTLQYFLSHCTGNMAPQAFYPPGLTRLLLHDELADVSYADTLEAYLANNLNITRTANVLDLHRSSLISRLERIEAILKLDLEDPEVQLLLRICLQIRK